MEAVLNWMRQTYGGLKLSSTLKSLWGVYSKPYPSKVTEVFILFSFCLVIGTAMGGLLYIWMVYTLNYKAFPSMVVASTWGSVLVLLLFFVHPVRCLLTISVPSLGTKQGRKIPISIALVTVATSCIPNMTRNVSRTIDMIKCFFNSTAMTTLDSTLKVRNALRDMKDFLDTIPDIVQTEKSIDFMHDVDTENIRKDMSDVSARLKAELSYIQNTMEVTSNVADKVIGGTFILLLLGSSVSYMIGYLTDLNHDNVYQTRRLLELLRGRGVAEVPQSYRKKLVKTTGWRMTQREVRNGLWGVTVLVFYGRICAMILGLDHFIFSVLKTLLSWAKDIPDVKTTIKVDLDIKTIIFGITGPVNTMTKEYSYVILLLPSMCAHDLSLPDLSVLSTIVPLFITALVMILGEVFSRRIRRKICSSFYRDREEERAQHLQDKILLKTDPENDHDHPLTN